MRNEVVSAATSILGWSIIFNYVWVYTYTFYFYIIPFYLLLFILLFFPGTTTECAVNESREFFEKKKEKGILFFAFWHSHGTIYWQLLDYNRTRNVDVYT